MSVHLNKLNAIVVDDSATYRAIYQQCINELDNISITTVCHSGEQALEILKKHPEVNFVILDVFMDGMDGIDTLKLIKSRHPNVVVVLTTSPSKRDAKLTAQGLIHGAFTYLLKPEGSSPDEGKNQLLSELKKIISAIVSNGSEAAAPSRAVTRNTRVPLPESAKTVLGLDLILIVTSTGGPEALKAVFKNLNNNVNCPILIVQHMPRQLTTSLAKSLDLLSSLPVKELDDNEILRRNHIYIVPGGHHGTVYDCPAEKRLKGKLSTQPPVDNCRPSANLALNSLAQLNSKRLLVVALTGMGDDGTDGLKSLKANALNKCYCITQSEEDCTVYGIPRAMDQAGLSNETLCLASIADRINELGTQPAQLQNV